MNAPQVGGHAGLLTWPLVVVLAQMGAPQLSGEVLTAGH